MADLEATIRPPIWRGLAGTIYAMAPRAEADDAGPAPSGGRRLRALKAPRQYRAVPLPRFARPQDGRSSSPSSQERPRGAESERASEHRDQPGVRPPGRRWPRRQCLHGAALGPGRTAAHHGHLLRRGPRAPVYALAFTPDGSGSITGGDDGVLRLWDLGRPEKPLATAASPGRNPEDRSGIQINTLAVSPDGRWVVIGREDGLVIRYDAVEGWPTRPCFERARRRSNPGPQPRWPDARHDVHRPAAATGSDPPTSPVPSGLRSCPTEGTRATVLAARQHRLRLHIQPRRSDPGRRGRRHARASP